MTKTIGAAELAAAVERAIATVRCRPEPILEGLVAPEAIDRVRTTQGLPAQGLPAQAFPARAVPAKAARRRVVATRHVIVGLVSQQN